MAKLIPVHPLTHLINERVCRRFWAKVPKSTADACWPWDGCLATNGYGRLMVAGKVRTAHRLSYEINVGPVPKGLDLDHICGRRDCVNPAHLEPVTRQENMVRGIARRTGKTSAHHHTHCINGHPRNRINLYVDPRGRRGCRACRREVMRRSRGAA